MLKKKKKKAFTNNDELALPALREEAEQGILPAEVLSLNHDATLEDAKKVDVEIANDMLKALYVGFTKPLSIKSLCSLASTTMDVVEKRRKLLCLQHGYSNSNAKSTILDPVD